MKSFLRNDRTILYLACDIEYRDVNMLNSQKRVLQEGKEIKQNLC